MIPDRGQFVVPTPGTSGRCDSVWSRRGWSQGEGHPAGRGRRLRHTSCSARGSPSPRRRLAPEVTRAEAGTLTPAAEVGADVRGAREPGSGPRSQVTRPLRLGFLPRRGGGVRQHPLCQGVAGRPVRSAGPGPLVPGEGGLPGTRAGPRPASAIATVQNGGPRSRVIPTTHSGSAVREESEGGHVTTLSRDERFTEGEAKLRAPPYINELVI